MGGPFDTSKNHPGFGSSKRLTLSPGAVFSKLVQYLEGLFLEIMYVLTAGFFFRIQPLKRPSCSRRNKPQLLQLKGDVCGK